MGRRKSLNRAPEREKNWDKIFKALVKLTQNLQKDRQFLEERIKFLNEVIYKMKMGQKVDSSKAGLILGLKDREAAIYKHRHENAQNELVDFGEWFDYLTLKCSKPNISSHDEGEGSQNSALENEVRKLKSEIEKYKLEKNTEMSALLAGKDSISNQFKNMENNFIIQLRKSSDEVEQVNVKVQQLVGIAEGLQSSNDKLRMELARMEMESARKSEEISQRLKEIELLKSWPGSKSSLLRSHEAGLAAASRRGKNDSSVKRKIIIAVETESDPPNTSEKTAHMKPTACKSSRGKAPKKRNISKGSSSSKRKSRDISTIPDTPKIFSSSFKVPKLKKDSSSLQIS